MSRVEVLCVSGGWGEPLMLDVSLVQEVDRLLRAGGCSQRAIAARLGVSRGTVSAIASGRRGLFGAQRECRPTRHPTTTACRCVKCGYRVYLPCLVCEARGHRDEQQRERRERAAARHDSAGRCDAFRIG